MVDTLVSGASASRHVGSSPIIRTQKEEESFGSSSFFMLDAFSMNDMNRRGATVIFPDVLSGRSM